MGAPTITTISEYESYWGVLSISSVLVQKLGVVSMIRGAGYFCNPTARKSEFSDPVSRFHFSHQSKGNVTDDNCSGTFLSRHGPESQLEISNFNTELNHFGS